MMSKYYYYKNNKNNESSAEEHKRSKHDDKCKRNHEAKLVGFAHDTADPIVSSPLPTNFPLTTTPQVLAALTLRDVSPGNAVWLQGLYHANNNSGVVADLITRIYRNSITPSNLIYQSVVEIDIEGRDDVIESVSQFVDLIRQGEEDVTYFLTAQKDPQQAALAVFVNGPFTFTAAEIKQKN
ncbi:hypothetical protein [Sutcliffiella rhizosphaerae]|uniref:Uncharacterized protein n=1 Tax=Sutcliffiella rhizosphaerae TaxID=2880967 RepID=A0ABN8A6C7_9BACI|nr:hypothetical protein [Sutcliffiella rhizosphaerae]CAG9619442.1 hypothetical protein BACCIP111883_00209 [Sutcliffiella rhizosphaerae]